MDLFCLHYIFLPRINRALQEYSEAYNHHPVRTEHNWSPYQLWYHSSIAAHNDDPIDLNDYGLDPQGPPPNGFDVDSVEVSTTYASLSPTAKYVALLYDEFYLRSPSLSQRLMEKAFI